MKYKNIEIERVNKYNNIEEKDIKDIVEFINKFDINNYIDNILEYSKLGYKFIGKGEYGYVFRYKIYAIKIFKNLKSNRDIKILKDLQELNIYPKLYATHKYFIVMEYIEGELLEYVKDEKILEKDYKIKFLNDLFETADKGYIPEDLHDENIIINKKGELRIIDVGEFRVKTKDINIIRSINNIFIEFESNYLQFN